MMKGNLKGAIVLIIIFSLGLGFFTGFGLMLYLKDQHRENNMLGYVFLVLLCLMKAIGIIALFYALFNKKAKIETEV